MKTCFHPVPNPSRPCDANGSAHWGAAAGLRLNGRSTGSGSRATAVNPAGRKAVGAVSKRQAARTGHSRHATMAEHRRLDLRPPANLDGFPADLVVPVLHPVARGVSLRHRGVSHEV